MGKISVVGIGPGSLDDMTYRARRTIEEATTVVGYKRYVELITELVEGKKVLDTGMTQEIDRCRAALKAASEGETVVVISSGDAGIYGMAGLVLELLVKMDEAERPAFGGVIPGVSAMSAAAGLLGAPIMHDFVVISLSDLLTPWEVIQERAELAAKGDFVTALYNPRSHKRVGQIKAVQEIFLRHRAPETPVGIVTGASRANEAVLISRLGDFTKEDINMFSIVIVGNSKTRQVGDWMITPRGYQKREPGL
ncbi:MAG: precorrin-3B C(17)-methyltransferase [Selenomonas massiliensis]